MYSKIQVQLQWFIRICASVSKLLRQRIRVWTEEKEKKRRNRDHWILVGSLFLFWCSPQSPRQGRRDVEEGRNFASGRDESEDPGSVRSKTRKTLSLRHLPGASSYSFYPSLSLDLSFATNFFIVFFIHLVLISVIQSIEHPTIQCTILSSNYFQASRIYSDKVQ